MRVGAPTGSNCDASYDMYKKTLLNKSSRPMHCFNIAKEFILCFYISKLFDITNHICGALVYRSMQVSANKRFFSQVIIYNFRRGRAEFDCYKLAGG